MERKDLIPDAREGVIEGTIRRAELARREAVFIGKDPENGLRMRVVNNTAVFLAQLEEGREIAIGRHKIEVGEEFRHETDSGGNITIIGCELVVGRKRKFVFSVPEGYTITKLVPRETMP